MRTTDRLMEPKQRERETAKERAEEAFIETLISFCTEKLTAPIFCVIFNVIFICTTYRIQTPLAEYSGPSYDLWGIHI